MESRVITKIKSKTGKEIILRYPSMDDLQQLLAYINTLSKEQTFIRYQGEEITLVEEERFLKSSIKKNQDNAGLFILAFYRDHLIGVAGIDMLDRVEKHIGILGITLRNEYRGDGIGRKFLQTVLSEAKEQIPHISLLTLGVFETNEKAIALYKDVGFVEYGKLPEGIVYKNEHINHIFMYKKV